MSCRTRAKFGKFARFNLATFGGVAVLDETTTEANLKGLMRGFSDGFLVPYKSCAKFRKVAHFSLATFGSVAFFDNQRY
jgi:hypothetical protein